jgi:hypothetical protein
VTPKIDYSFLLKRSYKLSDIKDKIEKVAFDVVRFTDSENIDDLWQVQHCDDGDYIVAMYEDQPKTATASQKTNWSVVTEHDNVHLFYKNSPLAKLSLAALGIPTEDGSLVRSYLPNKLASSKTLVNKILNDLSTSERASIYKQFPELI